MAVRLRRFASGAAWVPIVLGLGASCDLLPFRLPEDPALEEDISLASGPYRLEIRAQDLSMALLRDDEILVTLPADALAVGRVDGYSDDFNYDPYFVITGDPLKKAPAGLAYLDVEGASLERADDTAVELGLRYAEGVEATLEIRAGTDGRFDFRWTPRSDGPAIPLVRLRADVADEERFYGLGEVFDRVEHRGTIRPMQIEIDGELESDYNEAHVPVPLLIGTRGWGLFVEDPSPMVFDLAATYDERVEVTLAPGGRTEEGVAFYLFAAEHPLDITQHYYDVTGTPRLPAPWALGPWIWRDENEDQAQVEDDIATIRALDLPTTGIWIDRPYASAVNTFDFDAEQFPDPSSMLDRVRELGFEIALWHTPYLDESDEPATEALIAEAEANGYYPPQTSLVLNSWGRPIDFTNPAAKAWWQGLLQPYVDAGIKGFKLDYAEDVILGLPGVRNVWEFSDGSDERTMHALYQLFYHATYAELLPDEGGFLLCRGGTYGDQVHGPIIWPGDLDAAFAKHRETVTDDGETYVAVGGLPASIIAGLSLGPSGFPFYGADTGGYRHSPPDKELFIRWFQQTSLSSVMQVGTNTNDVAWEPTPENGFDAQVLELYREYASLHLRLWPYLWTYAERVPIDGRPLQRALGLAYPELGVHPDDTYLLGDHLLVAPVVDRGAIERDVVFPPGEWIDWWSGQSVSGQSTVAAPLERIPLFARRGSLIPMLRPTIETLSPTADRDAVDSYADPPMGEGPGRLWLRIAAGADGELTVFDGFEASLVDDGAVASVDVGRGASFVEGAMLEVMALGGAPRSVAIGGRNVPLSANLEDLEAEGEGAFYDQAGRLFVKVAADRQVRITR